MGEARSRGEGIWWPFQCESECAFPSHYDDGTIEEPAG